eukprot:70479_1
MSFLIVVCSIYISFLSVQSAVKWKPGMKSFSSAIKDGIANENKETLVFSYNKGPGCITEQWYTGTTFNQFTIVNYYIDNDKTKTISFRLFLAHGIGFGKDAENENVPWGTKRIGHNAKNGALYNTNRVPFQHNITITIIFDRPGAYYYIVRGVENYPVVIGDLELPTNAQLILFKNENVTLEPFQFITLANVTNMSGLLYQVTVEGESSDYNYLEACFRALIDNDPKYQFLSSGTEDFFLSAYYFNTGIFHDNDAGCSYFDGKGKMSAYKFFESDPVLFDSSFALLWRNCESLELEDSCPSKFPNDVRYDNKNEGREYNETLKLKVAQATVTTYTWLYVWS